MEGEKEYPGRHCHRRPCWAKGWRLRSRTASRAVAISVSGLRRTRTALAVALSPLEAARRRARRSRDGSLKASLWEPSEHLAGTGTAVGPKHEAAMPDRRA